MSPGRVTARPSSSILLWKKGIRCTLERQREGRRSLMFRHEKAIPSRTVGCCGRLERRPWSLQSMFFRCSIHPRRRPCCRPQAQESRVYIRLHSLGFDLQCLGGISPPSSPLCLPRPRALPWDLLGSKPRNYPSIFEKFLKVIIGKGATLDNPTLSFI